MPVASGCRSAAFGAVAILLVGWPAAAQRAADAQPAPASPSAGSYNPGEMLRDLANPVVAEVDGRPITLAEVGDAIRSLPSGLRALPFEELYPGVLERLIQQQALVQKARRMHLDLDPVVKRHMQAAADQVLENELLNRLLDADISEQALLARYDSEYAHKPGPEEADVRVIRVPTEEQARKLIAELTAGADFATVARRDSTDVSGAQGGALGFLRQDKLAPELGAAAFMLAPGQVSPNPVRGRGGWFVIKVEAKRRVPPPGFAEVREQLRHQMMQEGVSKVAQQALAEASVRRFNMNGTEIGAAASDKAGAAGAGR